MGSAVIKADLQQQLQTSVRDNDVLLYFPIHDLWTKDQGKVLLQLDVHHYDQGFGATAFDYVSDRQLGQLKVGVDGQASIDDHARYLTVVLPSTDYLPEASLVALQELGSQGIRVMFTGQFPTAYSGLSGGGAAGTVSPVNLQNSPGFFLTSDLLSSLDEAGIRRESLREAGLDFIRKTNDQGILYFVTNLGDDFHGDSLNLNADYRYVTVYDPLTGRRGYVETDDRFYLDVPPGQSFFLQASVNRPDATPWQTLRPVDTIRLGNPWTIHFAGMPADRTCTRDSLTSWTHWEAPELDTFLGKATYATTLHLPSGALRADNRIELVVQNLSANKMRAYDAAHPGWEKFYDINFVDITYRPFEAARWP